MTGVLRLVAVDGERLDPGTAQIPHHPVGAVLGAGKDQGGTDGGILQQMQEQTGFVGLVHEIDRLHDGVDRGRNRGHGNVDRIGEQGVGQTGDLVRHGGGKQQALPPGGKLGNHFLDIVDEPHVQHTVGFVQDENFQIFEMDVALADQVIEAAGSGH